MAWLSVGGSMFACAGVYFEAQSSFAVTFRVKECGWWGSATGAVLQVFADPAHLIVHVVKATVQFVPFWLELKIWLSFMSSLQVQHECSSHLENKPSAALKLPEVSRHLVTSNISPAAAVLQQASWPTLCKCSLSLISSHHPTDCTRTVLSSCINL